MNFRKCIRYISSVNAGSIFDLLKQLRRRWKFFNPCHTSSFNVLVVKVEDRWIITVSESAEVHWVVCFQVSLASRRQQKVEVVARSACASSS